MLCARVSVGRTIFFLRLNPLWPSAACLEADQHDTVTETQLPLTSTLLRGLDQ